jgi:hypothetical protein
MSQTLIIITGLIYAYISAEQFYLGNSGMGICYFGYAFANIGFYLMVK